MLQLHILIRLIVYLLTPSMSELTEITLPPPAHKSRQSWPSHTEDAMLMKMMTPLVALDTMRWDRLDYGTY